MKHSLIVRINILLGVLMLLMPMANAHGNDDTKKEPVLFLGLDTEAAKVVIQFRQALLKGNKVLARSLLDDNVMIYEGGGVERSAEEYANHHLHADIEFLSNMTSKTIEHQVLVSGDMAVSNARSETKGEYKGKQMNVTGMETIVLMKSKGVWKIIRIHWS